MKMSARDFRRCRPGWAPVTARIVSPQLMSLSPSRAKIKSPPAGGRRPSMVPRPLLGEGKKRSGRCKIACVMTSCVIVSM